MAFEFQCQCGKLLSAEESWVGRNARCPDCGVILIVPPPLEQDDTPVFDPEADGNGPPGTAEQFGDWDQDMGEVTPNPWIAGWQAIKQRFHKPNYYQLTGACGIVLLGVTVFLAVKWFGPRLGGPESALADQQTSAETNTPVLEELLKPAAPAAESTDNTTPISETASADDSAKAVDDHSPTDTAADSTADHDTTTAETSNHAPAQPDNITTPATETAQAQLSTPETTDPADKTMAPTHPPTVPTPAQTLTGDNSTPPQAAAEIVRITNSGDSNAFQAIRRHGLFLPSGEELALVLDTEHHAFDSMMSKAVSRQILSSIAFNDGDLLFWLDEAQYFSQELTIQGKPAKDMMHILIFPRSGSGEAAMAFKRFRAGNIRNIKELERNYGPAQQYQYWQVGSPQLDGEVYWWGNVGVVADADNRITFVLLRAPQMTK